MRERGKIIAIVGTDPKAGTTMTAKALAQELAGFLGEPVLFLSGGEKGRVIRPKEKEELRLMEAGVSYFAGVGVNRNYGEYRSRYAYTIVDGGSGKDPSLLSGADKCILVANQLASSLKEGKRLEPDYFRDSGLGNDRWLLILNRFRPEDPHDGVFMKETFPRWNWIPLADSEKGRKADWEEETILALGDRMYRKGIREGVKWILKN